MLALVVLVLVGCSSDRAVTAGSGGSQDLSAIVARAVNDGAGILIFDSMRQFNSTSTSVDEVYKVRSSEKVTLVEGGLVVRLEPRNGLPRDLFIPFDSILLATTHYAPPDGPNASDKVVSLWLLLR